MKTINYILLPGMGPEEENKTGNIGELLEAIPYLLIKKRLPPLAVLNSILEKGLADSGMSGGVQWSPFTIDAEDYSLVKSYFEEKGFDVSEKPDWVKTYSDFQVWEFEVDHGVPAEKHKKLADLEAAAQCRLEQASESNKPEDEVNKLHLEFIEAANDLTEFLDNYL